MMRKWEPADKPSIARLPRTGRQRYASPDEHKKGPASDSKGSRPAKERVCFTRCRYAYR
jgi:hypothetical protein